MFVMFHTHIFPFVFSPISTKKNLFMFMVRRKYMQGEKAQNKKKCFPGSIFFFSFDIFPQFLENKFSEVSLAFLGECFLTNTFDTHYFSQTKEIAALNISFEERKKEALTLSHSNCINKTILRSLTLIFPISPLLNNFPVKLLLSR